MNNKFGKEYNIKNVENKSGIQSGQSWKKKYPGTDVVDSVDYIVKRGEVWKEIISSLLGF